MFLVLLNCLFINRRSVILLLFFWSFTPLISRGQTTPPSHDLNSALQIIRETKLYSEPTWLALLQNHPGSKEIPDEKFFLSHERDPQSELIALVQNIFSESHKETMCRFPARSLWIKERLHLEQIDFKECHALNEFMERAPAENIFIVFAAENISQPSSMMGHVFFKLEGINSQGIPVSHMISFFTEIRDTNVPKLIWESLVAGKKSYYTLSPYEENKNYYLFKEQRNIWEYKLRLDPFKKRFLRYYLFELKNISFSYFFQSFNCATLTRNILAVSWPEVVNSSFWVTPLDVVRTIDSEQYAESVSMIPATRWKIKTLKTQLQISKNNEKRILNRDFDQLSNEKRASKEQWLTYDLASAYNDYQLENDNISLSEWRKAKAAISKYKNESIPNAQINIFNSSNPSATQQDSQLFSKYLRYENDSRFILGLLPATHSLMDDSRQYLNQWELKLGEISLLKSSQKNSIELNSFILYSAISLSPSDDLIPTYSGLLRIGAEPKIDDDLSLKRTAFIEGGLGKTLRLLPSIDFHWMILAGYQPEIDGHLFAGPQIGLRVLEIHRLQSMITFSSQFRPQRANINQFAFSQIYNSKLYSVSLELQNIFRKTGAADLRSYPETQNSIEIAGKLFF